MKWVIVARVISLANPSYFTLHVAHLSSMVNIRVLKPSSLLLVVSQERVVSAGVIASPYSSTSSLHSLSLISKRDMVLRCFKALGNSIKGVILRALIREGHSSTLLRHPCDWLLLCSLLAVLSGLLVHKDSIRHNKRVIVGGMISRRYPTLFGLSVKGIVLDMLFVYLLVPIV